MAKKKAAAKPAANTAVATAPAPRPAATKKKSRKKPLVYQVGVTAKFPIPGAEEPTRITGVRLESTDDEHGSVLMDLENGYIYEVPVTLDAGRLHA